MLHVAENEGQVKDRHFGHEIAQHGGAGEGHVHGAEGQAFNKVALIAQLAGGVDLDFHFAVGALFHQVGEMVRALAVGIFRLGNVPQFQGDGRGQSQGCAEQQNGGGGHDGAEHTQLPCKNTNYESEAGLAHAFRESPQPPRRFLRV